MDKTMVEQEIILRRKLDLLLRTGKILVESAADTNRIVRNMNRVAAYLGLPEENLHIDVTYTMLVVNLSDESHSYSKFQKCEKHGINMTAISEISKLSWRAIEEDYSLDRYEEELEKIDVINGITDVYPPTFCMTAVADFQKEQAPALVRKLMDCNVPFVYRMFGDKVNQLGHVFHCDIKTIDAAQCNDAECDFFREFCF